MLKETDLKNYQLHAINYIIDKKKCALNLDMGLGKTIISLTAFTRLLNKEVKKLLIVAPLNVAKTVWHEEIKKWEHTKFLKYSICCGSSNERMDSFEKDADVFIINHENINWMVNQNLIKFGMIIIDESSSFKSYKSKKFKSITKFSYKYMVLLTGTPIPNGYMDIWSQQYIIDRGKLLGKNITAYRNNYFIQTYSRYVYKCIKPDVILELLKANWLSIDSKNNLQLPNKINKLNKIIFDEKLKNLYKKFKSDYLLTVNDKDITAANAAVLTNKLLQFCNGTIYNNEDINGVINTVNVHDKKLNELNNIINLHKNDNILIAYNFKCDKDRIVDTFDYAHVLAKDNVTETCDLWNNNRIKLLLCQCNTVKGLNLQQGGNIIVWFSLTWNLESYLQFNARLYRQGQKNEVIVYHIILDNSIETFLLKKLFNKNVTQRELIDSLKHNLFVL